ncbi:hypothetical protein Curi_c03920 [Gottschalkia acidurici 9a]|uniref:Uncharacterized protein n=1 Tax=Gottschalkia acidurici (strain ATCC 7906 / DSM 604 / BCRC 14475 / CIP 104303 / KCTC 5404 / NCIMB 10678 / 9a) TaxID=1128398 RepID=K0AXH4_GOTA9|nr:hypothetical protein [Gottschalkia acidurici]AFS77467.1 hypothetical protein Curi_c03920 [Gottschalkia acidurici 9a]
MTMKLGEQLDSYYLPTSTFLYITRGSAKIYMDGDMQITESFHIIHGGKGMCLDIIPKESLEYYLIMYKAMIPPKSNKEIMKLIDKMNPY